jgi:hypothetical protein
MNKLSALIGAFILLSLPAFPQELSLSTGYGLTLGANFDTLIGKLNDGSLEARQSYNQFNFGALIFFDMGYITTDLTFSGSLTSFVHNDELKKYTYVGEDYALAGVNVGLGVYGKYPFKMDRIVLFPILGVQLGVGAAQNFLKDFEGRNAKKGNSYGVALDWTALAIKAGVGFDFDLNPTFFLRGGFLVYYKLNSLLDKAFVDAITNSNDDSIAINMNFGFDFQFLVGCRIGRSPMTPAPRNAVPSDINDVPDAITAPDTNNVPPRGGGDEIFYPNANNVPREENNVPPRGGGDEIFYPK